MKKELVNHCAIADWN